MIKTITKKKTHKKHKHKNQLYVGQNVPNRALIHWVLQKRHMCHKKREKSQEAAVSYGVRKLGLIKRRSFWGKVDMYRYSLTPIYE